MRILVFQHLSIEHPGIFRDFFARDGHRLDVVEWDEGEVAPEDLSPWDALLVMGGPMDVWEEARLPWLALEKAAIRRWLELGKPFLGICLGHQLLAEAAGGVVGKAARAEVGICAVARAPGAEVDALFAARPARFPALQWHGAAVLDLPPGATLLAVNDEGAIEAFRAGDCAWGVQYHVEVTEKTVGEWAAVPEYAAALEVVLGAEGQGRFERETAAILPALNQAAAEIYAAFMAVVARKRGG
jgi:GMP synthase-like glutamine amidotransferase